MTIKIKDLKQLKVLTDEELEGVVGGFLIVKVELEPFSDGFLDGLLPNFGGDGDNGPMNDPMT